MIKNMLLRIWILINLNLWAERCIKCSCLSKWTCTSPLTTKLRGASSVAACQSELVPAHWQQDWQVHQLWLPVKVNMYQPTDNKAKGVMGASSMAACQSELVPAHWQQDWQVHQLWLPVKVNMYQPTDNKTDFRCIKCGCLSMWTCSMPPTATRLGVHQDSVVTAVIQASEQSTVGLHFNLIQILNLQFGTGQPQMTPNPFNIYARRPCSNTNTHTIRPIIVCVLVFLHARQTYYNYTRLRNLDYHSGWIGHI